MARYITGRIVGALVTVFLVSIIAFVLVRVLPGDPVRLALGTLASQAAVDHQREIMGLDNPIPIQYFDYVASFARGDWGFAYGFGTPVKQLFLERLPATVELAVVAFAIAFVGAVLAALVSTYRKRQWLDVGVRGLTFLGLGTPSFWFALLLLLLFSQQLGLLPGPEGQLSPFAVEPPKVTGLLLVDSLLSLDIPVFIDSVRHLVLPAIALGFAPFALITRVLRNNLLEASKESFVLVARGKGNSRWRSFTHHVLPNAFLPTLTISGIIFAELFVGSVLIEKVFAWPGVGELAIQAISRQEFGVVQAFVLLSAVSYVTVNLLVDLISSIIDPRIRAQIGTPQ